MVPIRATLQEHGCTIGSESTRRACMLIGQPADADGEVHVVSDEIKHLVAHPHGL